jgi:hypothetical protein
MSVASGGSPRLAGSPFFFALAVTACGRRQGGVGGFAAGVFCWRLAAISLASPRPSPSLQFLRCALDKFGEGAIVIGLLHLDYRF